MGFTSAFKGLTIKFPHAKYKRTYYFMKYISNKPIETRKMYSKQTSKVNMKSSAMFYMPVWSAEVYVNLFLLYRLICIGTKNIIIDRV
jgi:hypothetical protein